MLRALSSWRRCVGPGAAVALAAAGQDETSASEEFASSCALPTNWVGCELLRVEPHTKDTSLFTFATPRRTPLHLPTCACLLLRAPGCEHGGGDAVRPYTPVGEGDDGTFRLVVKRYAEWGFKPEGNFDTYAFARSYRPAGAVSNYVFSRSVGESVEFKHVSANVRIPYPFIGVDRLNLIAVGAGIAPMVQALEKLLNTPGDNTDIVLLYGNRTVEDILMRDKLDKWAVQHAHRFKVVYCVGSRYSNVKVGMKLAVKKEQFSTTVDALTAAPELDGMDGLPVSKSQASERGWVGKVAISKHAFAPSAQTRTFVCGLPSVYDSLCGARADPECTGVLRDLGYLTEHVVKF
ncbi:hypothetical protein M885DRAFT_562067 [Pelagophyceae sp. CCMP2097]|nr:hypothetical protein M885DRAFT_562067 [Pelagophyceae sp. CCMP2097]